MLWPAFRQWLRKSSQPILVGPFRGEVGFEALYWVPFIRALGIAPDRLIPITRGGSHLWYPANDHVELYALRDPREVRVENMYQQKQTGLLKQTRVSAFDRAVIRDAAASRGLRSYQVLHPAWMYETLAPYWEGARGLAWLHQRIRLDPLPAVEADGVTLPPQYVAVRFYYRHTFPMNDACKTAAIETIKQIARVHPVIVLNANVHADEHVDVALPDIPNVLQLKSEAAITPQNNLAFQSAILSKALGFVGTYGGLAQLAMLYRKPTVSFYQDWGGTAIGHKHFAEAVAMSFGVACQTLRVSDIALLREVLPSVIVQPSVVSSGAAGTPTFTSALASADNPC